MTKKKNRIYIRTNKYVNPNNILEVLNRLLNQVSLDFCFISKRHFTTEFYIIEITLSFITKPTRNIFLLKKSIFF